VLNVPVRSLLKLDALPSRIVRALSRVDARRFGNLTSRSTRRAETEKRQEMNEKVPRIHNGDMKRTNVSASSDLRKVDVSHESIPGSSQDIQSLNELFSGHGSRGAVQI